MIGAIIGDIVGSVYEFHNLKSKSIEFFRRDSFFTDDTVMTLAVAKAVSDYLNDGQDLEAKAVFQMQRLGREFEFVGYGQRFRQWIKSDTPAPYDSFGNGSAMRCSSCGRLQRSLEECLEICDAVTRVTHNHPEGMKGARATTEAIWLASHGKTKDEIRHEVESKYYKLDFTLDQIRPDYKFYVSCQGSVPQAIEAFLESVDFEDAIRNAVSIGGDSDTIAAITGGIAEAFYGVPEGFKKTAIRKMANPLRVLYSELVADLPYLDNLIPYGQSN